MDSTSPYGWDSPGRDPGGVGFSLHLDGWIEVSTAAPLDSIAAVIYCVVPEPLAGELYDRLASYYEDDPNVHGHRGSAGSGGGSHGYDRRRPSASCATGAVIGSRASSRGSPPTSPDAPVKVVVHVDGGARGNPGPAAAAAVVSTPDGEVLDEAAETLGDRHQQRRGVPRAAARPRARAGARAPTEVEVVNDSELVARQVNGVLQGQAPRHAPLHAEALDALGASTRWSIRSVPRAQNADADALVNQALDADV